MTRAGEHEYYAALPKKADTKGAAETLMVKRGGVYCFAAWNAFSLEFTDEDITPYKVHVVGQAEDALAAALEQAGNKLRIMIER